MYLHNDDEQGYKPLMLLNNVRYANYQLYAIAGQGKKPETVLVIAILETMKWLRQRFRALSIPAQLDCPDPEQYAEVDYSAFRSFQIDVGYKVQVVWLPDEQIWTMQIIEPDLGTQPGVIDQNRPPVPGRLFETNIAYRIFGGRVECGFQTMVSEPVGTTAACEVFRLAFIKHLARKPEVGLRQEWPIIDTHHNLDNAAKIQRLQRWLKDQDRMMPIVIIAECEQDRSSIDQILAHSGLEPLQFPSRSILHEEKLPNKLPAGNQKLPFEIDKLTRYRMGYAQFFVLPLSQREAFQKNTGHHVAAGEVLVLEPKRFGGEAMKIPALQIKNDPQTEYRRLEEYVQNYSKKKPMTFGNVIFLNEAVEIERDYRLRNAQSKEEVAAIYEQRILDAEIKHKVIFEKQENKCSEKDNEILQLKAKIEELREEKVNLQRELKSRVEEHLSELVIKNCENRRLKSLLERPTQQKEIVSWVDRCFEHKLNLHPRARKMLQDLPPNKVDLRLLCDALEYLAIEYRDQKIERFDDDELKKRCNQKYKYYFEVTPVTGTSVTKYFNDYHIQYSRGGKGKPVDCVLDRHLRHGVDSENLLRIYFLYDKEEKLIVVGSLPEHLKTVSD